VAVWGIGVWIIRVINPIILISGRAGGCPTGNLGNAVNTGDGFVQQIAPSQIKTVFIVFAVFSVI
jgi:hypothetical protein